MRQKHSLLGVVICGGASTRMGRDKAALSCPAGGTFLSVAISRIAPLCNHVALAGLTDLPSDLQDSSFVSKARSWPTSLHCLPDKTNFQGPLSGLITSLRFAKELKVKGIIATPVDMPKLTTRDLQILAEEFDKNPNEPLVATFDSEQLEPLVAIYPTTVLPDLEAVQRSSDHSIYRWLKRSSYQTRKLPIHSSANMNAPSDLHPIEQLAERLAQVETEAVALNQAVGRILQQPITADRDSPAANVSAMDGFALRLSDAVSGNAFPVIGTSQPGSPPPQCSSEQGVVQIFTGSVVPEGFQLVVRREDVTEHRDSVAKQTAQITLGETSFTEGMNIRFQGENAKAGSIVVAAGTQLHAGHIATAANFGHASLNVARKVRVRIIVTGDELQSIESSVSDWQLRDSNGPTLFSLLSTEGWLNAEPAVRAVDNYSNLVETVRASLEECDALLLTGGVSMGDFDFVPKASIEAGCEQIFHKLPIRPGKPIFGAVGPRGQLVLGLPGNPVSAAVGAVRIAKPLLRKMAGCQAWLPAKPLVMLEESGSKTIPLTWFRLIQLAADGRCTPTKSQGSGDLVSMSNSIGFIEMPPNESGPGPWPLWRWQD